MNMQSILIFQIIADVVLCAAMVFLLVRMEKNIGRAGAGSLDEPAVLELQRLMNESRNDLETYNRTIEGNVKKLKHLALMLEEREGVLRALVKEAENKIERMEATAPAASDRMHDERYAHILKYVREGLTPEEIAARSGVTAGEVSLIMDLENKKKELARR